MANIDVACYRIYGKRIIKAIQDQVYLYNLKDYFDKDVPTPDQLFLELNLSEHIETMRYPKASPEYAVQRLHWYIGSEFSLVDPPKALDVQEAKDIIKRTDDYFDMYGWARKCKLDFGFQIFDLYV